MDTERYHRKSADKNTGEMLLKNLDSLPRGLTMPFRLESVIFIPRMCGKLPPCRSEFEVCVEIPNEPECGATGALRKKMDRVYSVLSCRTQAMNQDEIFPESIERRALIFGYAHAAKFFFRDCSLFIRPCCRFVMSQILAALHEEILIRLDQHDVRGNADRLDYLALEYIQEAYLNSRSANPPTSDAKNWDLLLEIAHYTDAHLTDGVTVDRLCQCFSVSRRTLFRFWKQHFASTPAAYIASKRAELARRLLQRTDLSVAEIAERCGYSNSSSFCSSFRHELGITPSEYRKQLIRNL